MADILPSKPDPPDDDDDREPRVVGIDSEGVEDMLSAISSDTARSILAELHENPATPSEVADRADTSIQNAQYHLGRLNDTGLVEEAGTAYSEKGREMTVYAPADRALVVVAGRESDTSGIRAALSQLLGGLGVVALGSVVVDRLARRGGASLSTGLGSDGGDGGSAGGTQTGLTTGQSGGATTTEAKAETETDTAATRTATESGSGSGSSGNGSAESTLTGGQTTSGDGGFHVAEATQTPQSTPTSTPASELEQTTRAAADSGTAAGDPLTAFGAAVASLSPGELFFLGGLVTVLAVGAYWWMSN